MTSFKANGAGVTTFQVRSNEPGLFDNAIAGSPRNKVNRISAIRRFTLRLSGLTMGANRLVIVLPVSRGGAFYARDRCPVNDGGSIGLVVRGGLSSFLPSRPRRCARS